MVTIGSDKQCNVVINNITDPNSCFSNDKTLNTPTTGGTTSNNPNMKVIIAAIVPSCVAVVLFVLLVVVSLVLSRRNGVNISQRPKSIHLHHRMGSGGESVTSFCPDSGLVNVYTHHY